MGFESPAFATVAKGGRPAYAVRGIFIVRYTISRVRKHILHARKLHKSILDVEFKPGEYPVVGCNVHVLSEVPGDTEVLYVLKRKLSMPEYVGAEKQTFIVGTDGTIAVAKL